MNDVLALLKTRRGLLYLAWVLLFLAILWPAPHAGPGANLITGSTGLYAFANLFRPELYPPARFAFVPRSVVFGAAFTTNFVFLFGIWFRDNPNPSRTLIGLLFLALLIDLALGFLLPDFTWMPGYWLWLAGVAAIFWAFLARPATGAAPAGFVRERLLALRKPGTGTVGVPGIVWIWLGWAAFWMALSAATPAIERHAERTAAIDAASEGTSALSTYVNDFAQVLDLERKGRLAETLAAFDKESSTQVVVALYPQLPVDAVDEFTIGVAERSRIGHRGVDNGVILFLFPRERVARIEVGYGLESALTDADAHRLLDEVLRLRWQAGQFDDAIEATAAAIIAQVQSAYHQGRKPGSVSLLLHQIAVVLPKIARRTLPALAALPTDARVGISFFGGLILAGMWDGLMQLLRVLRNTAIAARNLRAGRSFARGTKAVRAGSIIDSLKILLFVVVVLAGTASAAIVAGGGTFGGAGALLHW